jgi:hypothetical protein
MMRCAALILVCLRLSGVSSEGAIALLADGYHVHPGDNIQDALQQAAANPSNKVVKVHAGEYRPGARRQALVWFNRSHDGIRLVAEGDVTLTAANPQLAGAPAGTNETGFPAAVNHVVYFGDGITSNTVMQGFRITGANGFLTREGTQELEPNRTVPKNFFFYADGGAIKIFGRSAPTLRHLEIADNFTSPCAGGISVQQQGFNQDPVTLEHCVFVRNRCQSTGAALDLLAGSSARVLNCLFVGNASNQGPDPVAKASGEQPFVNNGVVTIFWKSRAEMRHCTFTGNRNGVDDMGGASTYSDCIFVDNTLNTGLRGARRYELAVNAGARVTGCWINGTVHDVTHAVSPRENTLGGDPAHPFPPPRFDERHVPQAPEYQHAGYRPVPRP